MIYLKKTLSQPKNPQKRKRNADPVDVLHQELRLHARPRRDSNSLNVGASIDRLLKAFMPEDADNPPSLYNLAASAHQILQTKENNELDILFTQVNLKKALSDMLIAEIIAEDPYVDERPADMPKTDILELFSQLSYEGKPAHLIEVDSFEFDDFKQALQDAGLSEHADPILVVAAKKPEDVGDLSWDNFCIMLVQPSNLQAEGYDLDDMDSIPGILGRWEAYLNTSSEKVDNLTINTAVKDPDCRIRGLCRQLIHILIEKLPAHTMVTVKSIGSPVMLGMICPELKQESVEAEKEPILNLFHHTTCESDITRPIESLRPGSSDESARK